MSEPIIFTIKDIVNIIRARQKNEFDANIAVTGSRGDGKSSCIFKILSRFKVFDPWKHQAYSRDEVIKLLTSQKYGLCWDDEAINSGYKRDFQNRAQQEMIKFLTAYRDNFNVFASAIPNFFSLDKDLRDLYFIHLFVAERGVVHVHMPIQGRIYSQDRWDAAYNAKVEAKWAARMKANPNFKPPYHKLTTFRGYLFFNDLTDKQKELYKKVKFEKRKLAFEHTDIKTTNTELTFVDKMVKGLIEGRITDKDFILNSCLLEGKKYSSEITKISRKLKDEGHGTINDLLGSRFKKKETKQENKVQSLIPV